METVEQLVSFNHIQVQLNGGAPWGFTLKGGLEHGEPLIITKIEDGGKAAQCKKLKVGDELININGSALYGSRQEALILIKGSYRTLKITVRSDLSMQWGQLSRPYSSTDRSSSLGSMESLDPATPTTHQYSDSHNSPVDPALFNNKRDSAYSSFSASSNTSDYATVPLRPGEACSMDNLLQGLGSACRGYPCRDVPTPGNSSSEAQDEAQLMGIKSRSLTRPKARSAEARGRPSSCCYEEDRKGEDLKNMMDKERGVQQKANPPQPPTRRDSFRATRNHPEDKRCVSAPVGIPSHSSYCNEDKESPPCLELKMRNGYPSESEIGDRNGNFKEESLELYYKIHSQNEDLNSIINDNSTNKDYDLETSTEHHQHLAQGSACLRPISSGCQGSLPQEPSIEQQRVSDLLCSETKPSLPELHRHSAPEKLLASQLQLLQFNGDNSLVEVSDDSNPSEPSLSSCSSQWTQSSHQLTGEDLAGENLLQASQNKWGGSRCSTPGSVFLDGDCEGGDIGERLKGMEDVPGGSLSTNQHHRHWGRSVSVPGDPGVSSAQEGVSSDRVLDREFTPLSSAASVDTLLEEQRRGEEERGGGKEIDAEGEAAMKKLSSSRNHRRNRRRSERFATNLRNEIQRKKAQLQKSRCPGGLLYNGETVHEEEGPDLHEQGGDPDPPAQERSTKVGIVPHVSPLASGTTAPTEEPPTSSEVNHQGLQTHVRYNRSSSVQILDPGVPSFGVGIRVVEEPAPAGKARRWRWTPEHKLQPEPQPDRRLRVLGERVIEVTGSRHGVCAFTSSGSSSTRSSSASRMEDSDILPFADRMKFFEETSRSVSVSNLAGLTSHRQWKHPEPLEAQEREIGQHHTQRRYSYQGGLYQEGALLVNTMEARRQSVSSSRGREREKEREREERVREQERELEERKRERQWEREREERELELERTRLREAEREREREKRVREWERERERELEVERERVREKEQQEKEREIEREREEREKEKERKAQPASDQDFYNSSGLKGKKQDFHHQDNLHNPLPQFQAQTLSHSQAHNQALRSAFFSVNNRSQYPENQPHTARSHTPTESYPAQQQETAKLNRKYSLTERDYPRWRHDSRTLESPNQHQQHLYQGQWDPRPNDSHRDDRCGSTFAPPPAPLSLRGRAMSENDLRYDGSHRWSPSISMSTSQTLCEVEEGGGGDRSREMGSIAGLPRRKTPPPPRPPPPKWEQFHRRRASYHTLFESPPVSSSSTAMLPPARHSISPSFSPSEGHRPFQRSLSIAPPETSRQRSYSLPPQRQEVQGGCWRCSCNQGQPQGQERTYTSAPSNRNESEIRERPYSHGSSNQSQAQIQEHSFSIAPPSPMFSRRAFRPVAPPHREKEGDSRVGLGGQRERGDMLPPLPPPAPLPPTENCVNSLFEMDPSNSPDEDSTTKGKSHKVLPNLRPGAEWERTQSSRVHSDKSLPAMVGNGVCSEAISLQSYFAINYDQQPPLRKKRGFRGYSGNTGSSTEPRKIPGMDPEPGTESETTLSPSPAHSLEAELDIPMETDIDDFQEEEGLPLEDEPISSELPCFALPVTVLETDIDTLPSSEASPLDRMRAESGSLDDELEVGERSSEELRLEELFPQGSEGESESWRGAYRTIEHNSDSLDRRSGASSTSSYHSTSAAKAQLLSQMKDQHDARERDEDDELTYKKQLMESLRKKLGVLREAQRGLQEDIRANAQLGEEVESMVVAVCKPNEVDKFRMFIGDLDKVVSLLLSLSGRLLRVETSLDTLDPDTAHHERLPLLEKKCQLMKQLSEAQDLKDHVDRREQAVGRVLARCLSPEQHRDYSHFVKMKAALLVEQKQLEDKIRLGEEQLRGLRESLGLGLGMGMGMSMGYGHY
ncbi:protein Shroom4 isoform X2 [Lampris incognitus]|uniref:protein Shroom4 isoform X2 n=1 Tax=Lampris incognitus TaxID=2546036 RepID=UPI0024B4B728|nr:protein Shroom4 isoform X2 [Lampris incognitus]